MLDRLLSLDRVFGALLIIQTWKPGLSTLCLLCATVDIAQLGANSTLWDSFHHHFNMPRAHKNCMETPISRRPDFSGTDRYRCPSRACSKVKGIFEDRPYVIRSCWDRLWKRADKPELPVDYEGCTPIPFLQDSGGEICVCRDDLCNSATPLVTNHRCLSYRLVLVTSLSALVLLQYVLTATYNSKETLASKASICLDVRPYCQHSAVAGHLGFQLNVPTAPDNDDSGCCQAEFLRTDSHQPGHIETDYHCGNSSSSANTIWPKLFAGSTQWLRQELNECGNRCESNYPGCPSLLLLTATSQLSVRRVSSAPSLSSTATDAKSPVDVVTKAVGMWRLGILAFLPTISVGLKCAEVERSQREMAKVTRGIVWNSFDDSTSTTTKWSIPTDGCSTSSICLNCMYADEEAVDLANLTAILNETLNLGETPWVKRCKELPISWMRENFADSARKSCASSGCTKIKGIYQDQPFIIRGCWENLWRKGHFLPPEYDDCRDIPFEPFNRPLNAHVCVCRDDLCNRSAPGRTAPLLTLLLPLSLALSKVPL